MAADEDWLTVLTIEQFSSLRVFLVKQLEVVLVCPDLLAYLSGVEATELFVAFTLVIVADAARECSKATVATVTELEAISLELGAVGALHVLMCDGYTAILLFHFLQGAGDLGFLVVGVLVHFD